MAQDKDKLADALSAMFSSGGEEEHAETHDQVVAEPTPQEPEAPPPEPPAVDEPAPVAAPVAPRPAAQPARPSRPAAPSIASPQAPVAAPAQAARRPSRPAAPTVQQPAAPAQPQRASRPAAPAIDRPTAPAAPAAPVSYARKNVKPVKQSFTGALEFRRALIPPCLVVGTLFPLLTLIFFLQPKTSPLSALPPYLPIAIAVIGIVLLAVGALNMVLVKNELDAKKK